MFKETLHNVIYTDAAFKKFGDSKGFLLAQVPFHKSRKYFLCFLLGIIPEWRSYFSATWLKLKIRDNYSIVYAFAYSTECVRFAEWISRRKKKPLIIHLADYSPDFNTPFAQRILKQATKLVCITEEMKSKYEHTLGRKDIEVLHNGAEQECFNIPSPSKIAFSKKNPFRLCFIGSLFSYLHGDCIEDFFSAVQIIREKKPWFEFHLYGQRQPNDFLNELISMEGCYHHGIVMPLKKKFEIMKEATCFVIPSSFSEQKIQITATHSLQSYLN